MPDLLLELFSEEIPARMQGGAARDLERMAADRFRAAGLSWEGLRTFAGPRRLTLVVDGLPAATPDLTEELKGPKANAPPQALEGFLRKTGLSRDALTERDGVLFATVARPGRPTPEIAAEIVGEIVRGFPWPKSMRSGASTFRWVRPLRRVLFLFDGRVVPFEIDGVVAGDVTEGHRFMGSGAPFSVRTFDEYQQKLAADFVILDAAARKQHILNTARAACAARGLELVEDEGLLEEVAGLAEWPTPLIGDMDPAFLDLPPEVIRTSMRTHQKYFAVRRPGESGLAPHFVVVANIEAVDEGEAIRRGNAKVLSARLSDARFFWDEDRKPGAFARWAETLKGVTFHQKLGTMAGRVERITALAEEIAPAVGADPKLTRLAASLCKLDLASQMVGEFPELQGIMGGYYVRRAPFASHAPAAAGSDGEEDPFSGVDQTPLRADAGAWWEGLTRDEIDQVADAVRDHYRPAGPSDSVPTAPVTVAVALADKLDTLVGFFAIGEKPTGSKDPYALRRAALGVIRLVLENKLRMPLVGIGEWRLITEFMRDPDALIDCNYFDPFYGEPSPYLLAYGDRIWRPGVQPPAGVPFLAEMHTTPANEVHAFIIERLKVLLREQGSRHDLIDAGSFSGTDDDLVRIVDRVEALSAFLATEDGANLLAGYKRAVNILRAEAKKDPDEIIAPLPLDAPAPAGLALEEAALLSALTQVSAAMAPRLAAEDFAGAMGELARLRAPVDAFFEGVLVNDPGPEVRRRRLGLLSSLRDAANRVADFSLIQG